MCVLYFFVIVHSFKLISMVFTSVMRNAKKRLLSKNYYNLFFYVFFLYGAGTG